MIESVLENARDGTVVFGGHEHHGVDRAQLGLESLHFGRLGLVVILVVERQIADPQFLECEIRWRESDECIGELAIVRILSEASNKVTNLPGHS
jgi:hypothetical protein